MSGLTGEQLDELEEYVAELLEKPWDSRTGRPREMTLREALIVASGYARNNITEEIWATIASTYSTTAACLPTASFYSARPERGKLSEPSGRCGFSGSLRYVSPTGGTGRDVRSCRRQSVRPDHYGPSSNTHRVSAETRASAAGGVRGHFLCAVLRRTTTSTIAPSPIASARCTATLTGTR
jgi:hypothetical protein